MNHRLHRFLYAIGASTVSPKDAELVRIGASIVDAALARYDAHEHYQDVRKPCEQAPLEAEDRLLDAERNLLETCRAYRKLLES
jgi:hypothetical protein